VLASVYSDDITLKIATAFISMVTLFISGYMKGFDLGATAQKNRDTAADLCAVP
jgi:hypothetical protein